MNIGAAAPQYSCIPIVIEKFGSASSKPSVRFTLLIFSNADIDEAVVSPIIVDGKIFRISNAADTRYLTATYRIYPMMSKR